MQFLIRAYDGEGKLDKRMEVRPRHLEYSFGVAEDELLLTEVWRDAEAIEVHKNSDHFAKLGELKAEYVENTEFMKFSAEQV